MCFFIRLFSKQNFEPRIFKNRNQYCSSFKFYSQIKSVYFFIKREYRFEIIHFGIFKRVLKRVSKKNYISKVFKKKNV